jgi:23S rRNA (guanine745-N1)-methyltransferase
LQTSVTELLRCPICGERMTVSEDRRSCFCLGAKRHCYDFARSGYLNLNPPTGGAGDLRDAIRARTCFLEAGYYQPLAERLEEIL